MNFTMDCSFDSLYLPPSQSPSKAKRFPRILTSLKHLTHSPERKLSVVKNSRKDDKTNVPQESTRPHAWENWQMMWKRRGHTPGMDDYLTLEQLENVWYKQDFYVGCVSVPQKVTEYTFTEAVEAPLIATHSPSARQQQTPRMLPDLNNPLPNIPPTDDTTLIDGALHPALRPLPYLESLPGLEPQAKSSNRVAVAVPNTNWTYGRD